MSSNSFFAKVNHAEWRIGRDGFFFALLLAGLGEGYGIYNLRNPKPTPFGYIAILGWAALVLALTIFFVQRMAKRSASTMGVVRFATGWSALLLPAAVGVSLAVPLFGRGTAGAIWWLLAGLLTSAVAGSLLPGWPVAMMFSGWRGPLRIFRASRGNRWPIIGCAFVANAITHASPDLAKAETTTGLLLRAGLDLGLSTFQLIWLPAVAFAAWQVAAANDPLLDADLHTR